MNTTLDQDQMAELQSPNQKAEPERKKPFIKPELKQRETLPEVTGQFVGSFVP